jgi:hypothetical protein
VRRSPLASSGGSAPSNASTTTWPTSKNGFGNSGSFLDVGSHRFYIAKPFLEEITDVFDSLYDGGSSCGESSNLGAVVEVMTLGEDEGSDLPRPERPSLERPPPQEQDAPLPE